MRFEQVQFLRTLGNANFDTFGASELPETRILNALVPLSLPHRALQTRSLPPSLPNADRLEDCSKQDLIELMKGMMTNMAGVMEVVSNVTQRVAEGQSQPQPRQRFPRAVTIAPARVDAA